MIFTEPRELPTNASCTSINRNQTSEYLGSKSDVKYGVSFMRKIPLGAEACNILVGKVDFLEKTLSVFIRLDKSVVFDDLTEVPVPTRFLFLLLTPSSSTIGK